MLQPTLVTTSFLDLLIFNNRSFFQDDIPFVVTTFSRRHSSSLDLFVLMQNFLVMFANNYIVYPVHVLSLNDYQAEIKHLEHHHKERPLIMICTIATRRNDTE